LERLFWVYGSRVADARNAIEDGLRQAAADWMLGQVEVHSCVSNAVSEHQLWLLRNRVSDAPFRGYLDGVVEQLRGKLQVKTLQQRPSLPAPLLMSPIGASNPNAPKTDIGLHSVNDKYSGMLVIYTYWQRGDRHQPVHFQLEGVSALVERLKAIWAGVASGYCRSSTCGTCGDVGCYDCFAIACPSCSGTGWKHSSRWAAGGFQVDYRRWPIAIG
jgi:hypothetical protein